MSGPNPLIGPRTSVEVDWFGALPAAHLKVFITYSRELESSYLMFSVPLDEAISLRDSGALANCLEDAVLASVMCGRLTNRMNDMLVSLAEYSGKHRLTPSVKPLDHATFLSRRGQQSARRNYFLAFVPRARKAQFLSKIRSLIHLVANVRRDFSEAVEDLVSSGGRYESMSSWTIMDASHYDLNTCLRESIVMLKCFLRSLPAEQLISFERTAFKWNFSTSDPLAAY